MSSPPSQANSADPSKCSPLTVLVPTIEPSKPGQAQPRLPPDTELQVKSPDSNAVVSQAALVRSDEGGFAAAGDAKPKLMEEPAWTSSTKAIRGVRRGRPPLGRTSRGARLKIGNGYKDSGGWVAVNNIDATPDGAEWEASRGRPRARGKNRGGRPRIHPPRGSGRGAKRRRGDIDEDDEGTEKYDTDATEKFSPLPAQSRSGRKIFKATTFTPVGVEATRGENLPGQGVLPKKRRRQGGLSSVCKNCGRGPSPGRNMIVYCDECDTPWHQHCHDPLISPATVRAVEEQWFCADCETAREEKQQLVGKISAEGMSLAEKRRYLQTLPAHDLIFLLLHATSLHPELPILNAESASAAGRAEEESDYYGLLYPDTDPLPYPKAGNGVRLPLESDDIGILIDDDVATFSHRWNWDSTGARRGSGMIHVEAPSLGDWGQACLWF